MTQQILDFFPIKSISNETDNFSNYELKYVASFDSEKAKTFNGNVYNVFNLKITSLGYDWSFEIAENNYTINQSKFEELDEIEQDEITITLLIFKKGSNVVIFNESAFFESIENIGLEGILKILKSSYSDGVKFLNNTNQHKFSSHFIGYNLDLKQSLEPEISLSSQCNFNNFSDFKYSPDCFNIGEFRIEDKMINLIAKIFKYLFSFTFLTSLRLIITL